jgi:hypothetical protein
MKKSLTLCTKPLIYRSKAFKCSKNNIFYYFFAELKNKVTFAVQILAKDIEVR